MKPSMNPARPARLCLCLSLLGLALIWQGPAWLKALQPRTYYQARFLVDFFQEWASARNYFGGLALYTSQEATLPLYLGEYKLPGDITFIAVNAHPPPSVLIALPFGKLDYAEAFLLWNAVSLVLLGGSIWIVLHNLDFACSPEAGFLILSLLLCCHPLLSHIQQGQLGIVVLFLITLCWACDRSDRYWLAGITLGIATAIKLFPGFLFLPFLLRRRWKTVFSGAATLAGVIGLTVGVFGIDTYREYVCDVLPVVQQYAGACHNLSFAGIWYKLLMPLPHWMPVVFAVASPHPVASTFGYLLASGIVVAILIAVVVRSRADGDLCFAASTVAMLLVAPIVWDHYLLLLVMPVALVWRRLPRSGPAWPLFLFVVCVLCIEPLVVMQHCLILMGAPRAANGNWLATPLDTVTALSVPSYAVAWLFALLGCLAWQQARRQVPPEGSTTSDACCLN